MDFGRRITASIFLCMAAAVSGMSGWANAAVSLGGASQAENYYSIQFDTIGVTNPTYHLPAIPNAGDLTVSFGTHFNGQSFGEMHNSLGDTSPSNPLSLASVAGTAVQTMFDLSHPAGPVLGGVPGTRSTRRRWPSSSAMR